MATASATKSKLEIVDLPIGKIDPDPGNPRKAIAVDDEFIQSIKSKGVLQAITVRTGTKPGRWTISFGERRWTGARAAGLKTVPCVVRDDLDPADVFEMQVMENIHRSALTPLEEAGAYVRLVEEFKRPQRELAKIVGRSQAYLSKHMSLVLRLPEAGQKLLDAGEINVSDAVLLASLHEHETLVDEVVAAYKGDGQGYHGGPATLDRALAQAKRAKTIDAARKKLNDAGVAIVDVRPSWQSSVGLGSAAFGVQVDPAAHAEEACHVAYVDLDGDVTVFCTDRDRHAPEGDSALKAANMVPPPPLEDGADLIAEFAEGIEAAAGTGTAPDLIEGKTPSEWMAAREARAAEQAAAQELRVGVMEIRRGFLRQLVAGDTPLDPTARAFLDQLAVVAAVDTYSEYLPDVRLAADLLAVEIDAEADDFEELHDFGPWVDARGKAIVTHPNQPAAVLATGLSIVERQLGPNSAWTDRLFADVAVRAFYDYLTAVGYILHDIEQQKLDAGAAVRKVEAVHEFVATGDNAATGACDICGSPFDAQRTESGRYLYRHSNAQDLLDQAAADIDPTFEVFQQARSALDLPANKKGNARKDAIAEFDAAKDAFAHRLVEDVTDPTKAGEQLLAINLAYKDRLDTIGPIRADHFDEDSAAYQTFTDQVLAVLEETGPLPATLRNAIRDHSELRLGEPPATRAGTIRWVHIPDLLEILSTPNVDDLAADFEFASTIPGYFEFDDDDATNRIALWVDDHELTADDLARLLRVETANTDAIDRPYLRAAIEKLLTSRAA